MIRTIRDFLNREKLYSWLLIISLFLYSFFLVFSEKDSSSVSPAMEKIKEVKASFQENGREKHMFVSLFQDNERLAVLTVLFTMLFVVFLGGGLCIAFYCLIQYLLGNTIISRVYTHSPTPWGNADIVKIIILFIFFSLVTGMVLGLVNDLFFDGARNAFVIIHTVITDIAVFIFILYFVAVKYRSSLREVGLTTVRFFKDMLLGFSTYCAVLPLLVGMIILLSLIVNYFQYEPPPHPLVDIFIVEDKENPLLVSCSIFLACTIGPFIEEVFFRGFCYPALKKKWGVRIAMVGTAAFFAAIHGSSFAFIPVFILGLTLALLFEKRGTLIPSITLHMIHNSLFITYFFIMKRVILDRVG